MSVEADVKDVIAKQLGIEIEKVTLEASFVDNLGADSLESIELIMAFEEEFNIEIPDEDAKKILIVQDAITYIKEKII